METFKPGLWRHPTNLFVMTLLILAAIFLFTASSHAGRSYTITATAGANGSISPSGSVTVNANGNQTFTLSPAIGYHVSNVTVDGTSKGAITSYTFSKVTANHTISAAFAVNTYTISATATSGGSVSPVSTTVNYGGSQTVTITPNTGYLIKDVTVDGISQGVIGSYTFSNITANHTLAATFTIKTFTLTATASNGGSISPASATVNFGASQTFTVAPNAGYHVADVKADGVSVGALTSYTFSNVTAPHSMTATFAANTPTKYIYDDLGRLSRAVTETSGVIYSYDALGNLTAITNASTAKNPPVLSSITPNVLFVGFPTKVTINGQNLLTTQTVAAANGLVSIKNVTATDTQIKAEITALSAGTETITVTTMNGTPNTASINATISTSRLSLSPSQIALAPGTSGMITATITPPLATPLDIFLESTSPTVATVAQTLTIPASGSAEFSVNALQAGTATIYAGGQRSVIFVGNTFSGDINGLTSKGVSVSIDAPTGPSVTAAVPVSVAIDAPTSSATSSSLPISVAVDAGGASAICQSGPVSVSIDASSGPSYGSSMPISVFIDSTNGSMQSLANPVSVKIQ